VSRVVNGAGNVSGEKRMKVLMAASELRFCPNQHAAELGRASRNISKRRGIHLPALARHKGKREF
jgi:DNA-binding LacI/PurR family transcriptional regulator